ncbi:MAG: nucleotidyltransferase family protein [Acetobacteraceae bacterium]
MGEQVLERDRTRRLVDVLRAAPSLMRVLTTVRALGLSDWLVFSGAVYQPVLNHLTGRAWDYGIKDYDIGYFDAADLSYEAEDAVIRRVASVFDEPLSSMVEVRNQARVHLWFQARFNEAYTPLSRTAEALERFTSPLFAVGVRLEADDRLHVEAPFGLADLFTLRLRPNPLRRTSGFERIARRAACRWPELVIETDSPLHSPAGSEDT